MAFHDAERHLRVARLEDRVLLELEDLADQLTHVGLVLDHEHGPGAPRRRGARLPVGTRGLVLRAREADRERRAPPHLARHLDAFPRLGDDVPHGREPEPGALPRLLGGEVGLEEAIEVVREARRDPARVLD